MARASKRIRLYNYKVVAQGPESTVTFYIYGVKSVRAAFLRLRKDEGRLSVLRKNRIYKADLKSLRFERVKAGLDKTSN